jgi:uncharacterized surface protein with fasciclin (FAS1) repeats
MFYDALKGTELDTQLTDDAQFTIFAPTTAAFEELSALTMAELEEDPLAMAHVLGYHIVPGYLPPASLVGEHDLETLSGETLHVSFTPGESFTVNGNAIGLQHRVTNGAIYLVNVVLLPESE